MRKQVAKSYDNFYSNEKILFLYVSWAQKYKIKSF